MSSLKIRDFEYPQRYSNSTNQLPFIKFSDPSLTYFNQSSKLEDGWILGPNSELLFWVPPVVRAGL